MRPFLRRHAVLAALLLAAGAARAETPKIYDGITQQELLDFAKRQGWDAEPWAGRRGVLLRIRAPGAATGGSTILHLTQCDAEERCRVGLLRSVSYYFIKNRAFLREWNLTNFGATGFSESYVTLQRYMHFRGVTDAYLKEVIGQVWAGASTRFWADVDKLAGEERRRTSKSP